MNDKLSGFAKDSLLYGLGDGLGQLGSIILLPILSRIFLPADYGIIDLLTVSYGFLLITIRFNILTGLQKFYYLTTGEERRVLVTSVLLALTAFSSFIAILVAQFSRDISVLSFDTQVYYIPITILACCLPLETLSISLLLLLRLKRRAVVFSLYNIITIVLTVSLTFACVVWLETGIKGIFIARITTFGILVPCLLFQQRDEVIRKVNVKSFWNLLAFAMPGHPSILMASLLNVIPRYILAHFSTLTAVGLYGAAMRIAKPVNLYKKSFHNAWNPFAFANSGASDEKGLYEKVFKVYAASLILIGMIVALFAKEAFQILTPAKYHSAFVLVGGICIYIGLTALRGIFATALYSVNKVKLTSYLNAVHLIVFLICAINLVPLYDAKGVVASLNIAAAVHILLFFVVTNRYFKINIPFWRLLLLLGLATIGVLFFNQVNATMIMTIALKLGFTFIYALVAKYILFSERELSLIRETISLLLRRGRQVLDM